MYITLKTSKQRWQVCYFISRITYYWHTLSKHCVHYIIMYIQYIYTTTVRQQSKPIQHNTTQYNSTRDNSFFPKKNELPQVRFEPTTLWLSRLSALPLSYRGSSDGRACIYMYTGILHAHVDYSKQQLNLHLFMTMMYVCFCVPCMYIVCIIFSSCIFLCI